MGEQPERRDVGQDVRGVATVQDRVEEDAVELAVDPASRIDVIGVVGV